MGPQDVVAMAGRRGQTFGSRDPDSVGSQSPGSEHRTIMTLPATESSTGR